jgi:hypothetical protein
MDREAKIRVKLDLTDAKADLKGLVDMAHATGQGIGGGIGGRAAGGGGGGFNLASMIGAGFVGGIAARAAGAISDPILGAITGPTTRAAGDVMSESFRTLGVAASQAAFGNAAPSARAGAQAREETIAAYGYSEGRRGGRPSDAAKAYFDSRMRQILPAEAGRTAIEGDDRFGGVTSVTQIAKDLGHEVAGGVDRILMGVRGFFYGRR